MRRTARVLGTAIVFATLMLFLSADAPAAPRVRVAYWLMADVIRGGSDAVGAVGVQTNVFKQGEEVVFRARVLDIGNGQDPGQQGKGLRALQDLGLKVTAYLEDGQSFPLSYGRHPAQVQGREAATWFWSAAWKIPARRAPGNVKWWVIVTDKSGASVRFDPIGAGTALPPIAIIIEKR